MKVKLLTTVNEKKLKQNLQQFSKTVNTTYNQDNEKIQSAIAEFIEQQKQTEKEEMLKYVASAGRLSRYEGTVFDIIDICENKTFEENCNFISMVTNMGHDSITDHDYLLFAIQDVTPIVEQTIIEERFASFTIKSRREVNFENVGFYTPDFHNTNGDLLENNEQIQEEYNIHIKRLFKAYKKLLEKEIEKEDARFILPYSYYSNIIMGVDAHTLKDMIIKLTKGKYKNITELRQFGEGLYEIAKNRVPYIIPLIDKHKEQSVDPTKKYLDILIPANNRKYKIINQTKLLNHTPNIDDFILISSLMRIYQFDYENAYIIYKKLCQQSPNFKIELMQKIGIESFDKLELTQANFQFQIPISLAVLTHLTRHRTHAIITPDFAPNIDITQYKIPPKINSTCKEFYEDIYNSNIEIYQKFKYKYNIRDEDLIYFTLSGNLVNIITNINGKTLQHILKLRECTKAQWETRDMAIQMHKEIDKIAPIFSQILGPSCKILGICPEKKESCGKVKKRKKS